MYIYQDYLGRLGDAVPMGNGVSADDSAAAEAATVENRRHGRGAFVTALTLAEKILAAHAGLNQVVPGQIVVADVDVAIAQDGTGPLAIQQIEALNGGTVKAPTCVFFIDHAAPAPRSELANAQKAIRAFCAASGATLSDVEMGVCHQRVAEASRGPAIW